MKKLTCFVAMVLAAVSAMAVAALAFAPRAFAQPASAGATGVCCIDTPECIITTEADCAQQGGIYGGDDTMCEPTFLNPFGACTCGPGQGNCLVTRWGEVGCESLSCCEIICLNDPHCCTTEWDVACSAFAGANPAACPRTPCTWECAEPDGTIDVPDLLTLLALWGSLAGICDFSGDGIINVPDLLALLAAWGACP